jgi:hypothetical protein
MFLIFFQEEDDVPKMRKSTGLNINVIPTLIYMMLPMLWIRLFLNFWILMANKISSIHNNVLQKQIFMKFTPGEHKNLIIKFIILRLFCKTADNFFHSNFPDRNRIHSGGCCNVAGC